MKIFYSWQSDIDAKFNREFIKECLEAAIEQANDTFDLEEAIRLDHDTSDLPGSPDIVNSVLRKITESYIFIGDLTFIGKSYSSKKLPNPNVLFELGYAFSCLTDQFIINTMNTEYGSPSNLPFDLAHKKWPICYNLSKSNYDKRSEIKLKLVNDLFTSINQIIKTNGTKDKLEPINNVPTINNIKKHIFFSNSKSGWHVHPVGYKINATYKIEPHLRIEVDIKKGKYKKSLTKNIVDLGFPDKSLFLCPCDIYFTGSLIDRYSLACVDNGRIIIPKPTYFYKEMNTFLVDDFEYKLSTLFNQKNEIREYLVRSKLSIMS